MGRDGVCLVSAEDLVCELCYDDPEARHATAKMSESPDLRVPKLSEAKWLSTHRGRRWPERLRDSWCVVGRKGRESCRYFILSGQHRVEMRRGMRRGGNEGSNAETKPRKIT